MTSPHRVALWSLRVGITLFLPACLRGQQVSYPLPEQCHQTANVIRTGVPDSTGMYWGMAPACGDEAAAAVATAILNLKFHPERHAVIPEQVAGMLRQEVVFDAAFQVAQDSTIAAESRETALKVMAYQVDQHRHLGAEGNGCAIGWTSGNLGLPPVGELSTELLKRFFVLARGIAGNRSGDPDLRREAECIVGQLADKSP
jgi:hypothetical protein